MTSSASPEVEVVHWNPRRRRSRWLPARFTRPVNNFGDLLGPLISDALRRRQGLQVAVADRRLLTVGSILHFARDQDVVWGSGVNGKKIDQPVGSIDIDVRAVRGPLTARVLTNLGMPRVDVFGDPGVLTGHLWPRSSLQHRVRRTDVTVVPNLHDLASTPRTRRVLDPRGDLWAILAQIADSGLVVGSSLHGIIVAESYGVPARLVQPSTEPLFKYQDYYEGTGRSTFQPARSIDEAVEMGGERPPVIDEALVSSFPTDLWRSA